MSTYLHISVNTPCPEKGAILFSTITLAPFGGFYNFIPLKTEMNTAQTHVIYLLHGLMTS